MIVTLLPELAVPMVTAPPLVPMVVSAAVPDVLIMVVPLIVAPSATKPPVIFAPPALTVSVFAIVAAPVAPFTIKILALSALLRTTKLLPALIVAVPVMIVSPTIDDAPVIAAPPALTVRPFAIVAAPVVPLTRN